MTRPEATPQVALAHVEEQLRRLREQVVPLTPYDHVIASQVIDCQRMADLLQGTLARTAGDASIVGHCLILIATALTGLAADLEAEGHAATQVRTVSNLLSLTALALVDSAQAAQDAGADR